MSISSFESMRVTMVQCRDLAAVCPGPAVLAWHDSCAVHRLYGLELLSYHDAR